MTLALTPCLICSFFSHMNLINRGTSNAMQIALTDWNLVIGLYLSFFIIGLEAIWEVQGDWSGRSKNSRRRVCGEPCVASKPCVASNPCGLVLSSTLCKLETANVRGRSSVNMQSWYGWNTHETGLFGPQAGQEHLFGYYFRGFPFSSAQWFSFLISTAKDFRGFPFSSAQWFSFLISTAKDFRGFPFSSARWFSFLISTAKVRPLRTSHLNIAPTIWVWFQLPSGFLRLVLVSFPMSTQKKDWDPPYDVKGILCSVGSSFFFNVIWWDYNPTWKKLKTTARDDPDQSIFITSAEIAEDFPVQNSFGDHFIKILVRNVDVFKNGCRVSILFVVAVWDFALWSLLLWSFAWYAVWESIMYLQENKK